MRSIRLSSLCLSFLIAAALLLTTTGCGEKIAPVPGAEAPLTDEILTAAEATMGLRFSDAEHELLREDVAEQRAAYAEIRALALPNEIPPVLIFDPIPAGATGKDGRVPSALTPRLYGDDSDQPPRWTDPGRPRRPENLEDLAFVPIGELAALIRTLQVSSIELTEMFLDRLRRHDPELLAVVTLTEDMAREQAERADAEIRAGRYRGPLHGIPYGAKDLLAVEGTRTTWGAEPYRTQTIDATATVVRKLTDAGAVLVAKLTLGALAWGDVWYGGMTRNPWRPEQGSSGSSAGPASAVSAGLVPFAIGTETWGSIVSPSARCGVTGLRPTFGRVSRAGAMALSWSMDKIGPICRSVEDCAVVFETIRGADGLDQSVYEAPFAYRPDVDLRGLRIGYLTELFGEKDVDDADSDGEAGDEDPRAAAGRALDRATLATLRALGAELIPVGNHDTARVRWIGDVPVSSLSFVLTAEAAAAFDALTLSDRDELLVRQIRWAWPNVFRASRFIPAVEYIQANRARYLLVQQMSRVMQEIDVYVAPSFGGDNLLLTNLTGHPCVVVPNGFVEPDQPHSISFIGDLFDEATVLAVAKAYQDATDFHRQQPPGFAVVKR